MVSKQKLTSPAAIKSVKQIGHSTTISSVSFESFEVLGTSISFNWIFPNENKIFKQETQSKKIKQNWRL